MRRAAIVGLLLAGCADPTRGFGGEWRGDVAAEVWAQGYDFRLARSPDEAVSVEAARTGDHDLDVVVMRDCRFRVNWDADFHWQVLQPLCRLPPFRVERRNPDGTESVVTAEPLIPITLALFQTIKVGDQTKLFMAFSGGCRVRDARGLVLVERASCGFTYWGSRQ